MVMTYQDIYTSYFEWVTIYGLYHCQIQMDDYALCTRANIFKDVCIYTRGEEWTNKYYRFIICLKTCVIIFFFFACILRSQSASETTLNFFFRSKLNGVDSLSRILNEIFLKIKDSEYDHHAFYAPMTIIHFSHEVTTLEMINKINDIVLEDRRVS